MDYEKKYKEALELMKDCVPDENGLVHVRPCDIFTELKESEGEQSRNWILEYLYDGLRKTDEQFKEQFKTAIAWLEKQGEQKPVKQTLSEEVDSQVWQIANNAGITWEQGFALLYATKNAYNKGKADAIKEQKPAEWSEEDEKRLDNTITQLKAASNIIVNDEVDDSIAFIKSLKDRVQPQLKQEWSEEDESHIRYHIECLEYCKKGVSLTMTAPTAQEYIGWLKSLRPQNRWKPSEKQKEALLWCVVHLGGADKQTLGELLEELNKL